MLLISPETIAYVRNTLAIIHDNVMYLFVWVRMATGLYSLHIVIFILDKKKFSYIN